MDKKTKEEQNCTEYFNGIIMLRKGILKEKEVWFATVGNQLVSDGTFETKEELVKNIEDLNLEKVCKIVAGAFARAIEISTKDGVKFSCLSQAEIDGYEEAVNAHRIIQDYSVRYTE